MKTLRCLELRQLKKSVKNLQLKYSFYNDGFKLQQVT